MPRVEKPKIICQVCEISELEDIKKGDETNIIANDIPHENQFIQTAITDNSPISTVNINDFSTTNATISEHDNSDNTEKLKSRSELDNSTFNAFTDNSDENSVINVKNGDLTEQNINNCGKK